MNQNHELPPGWGGDSFQENPWANAPKTTDNSWANALQKQNSELHQPTSQQQSAPISTESPISLPDSEAVFGFLKEKAEFAKKTAETMVSAAQELKAEHTETMKQKRIAREEAQRKLAEQKEVSLANETDSFFRQRDIALTKPLKSQSAPVSPTEPPELVSQADPQSSVFNSSEPAFQFDQILREKTPAQQSKQQPVSNYPSAATEQDLQANPQPAVFNSSDLDLEFDLMQQDISDADKFSPLIVIIPIIIVALAFLGGLLWMKSRSQDSGSEDRSVQKQSVPVQEYTEIEEKMKEQSSSEMDNASNDNQEIAEDSESSETATMSPEPKELAHDYPSEFRSIASQLGAEVNTGYYSDVNADGIDELILKNPSGMNFHLYKIDSSGDIQDTYFGCYTSMNEVKLYRVPAADGYYYFYWHCDYAYFSLQGYYDPQTGSHVDIEVDYSEPNWASWRLYGNDEEYCGGGEAVSGVYGATPDCFKELLMMFQIYGFDINEDSKYQKLECLDKGALLNAIK